MNKCMSYLAAAALGVSASASYGEAYIGAAVGYSELEADEFSDFNSDNSISLTGGYRINKHLAVEVSYVNLGEFSNRVSPLELLNGVGQGEDPDWNALEDERGALQDDVWEPLEVNLSELQEQSEALAGLSSPENLDLLNDLTRDGFDVTDPDDVAVLVNDLGQDAVQLAELAEMVQLSEQIDAINAEINADSIGLNVETDGFNLAVVGILPISKRGELYAKIGAFMWESSLTVSGLGEVDEDDGVDLSWALGMTLNVTEHVSVALEYQRYVAEDLFDATDIEATNVAAGVRYTF